MTKAWNGNFDFVNKMHQEEAYKTSELVVMFHLISGQNEQWFLDIVDQLVSLCPVLEEEEHHHSRIDVVGSLYPQCTASNPEELEHSSQMSTLLELVLLHLTLATIE